MFSGRSPGPSGLLLQPTPTRTTQNFTGTSRQVQFLNDLRRRSNSSQAAEPSAQEPFYAANEHQRRRDSSAGPAASLERLGADNLLQLLRARQTGKPALFAFSAEGQQQ